MVTSSLDLMKYLNEFKTRKDIASNYQGSAAEDLRGATIHLAWYGYGSYCGSSLVIYEKDGKLFEVNGSHCSCHGLEGQWQPAETTWEALKLRDLSYNLCDGSQEAHKALQRLVNRQLKKLATVN